MTHVLKSGRAITFLRDGAIESELKPGFYIVQFSPQSGYFLTEGSPMTVPSKIYGDPQSKVDRIIHTFEDRSSSTGVHLDGKKGSGKTMLAKLLANNMVDKGYPVIIVSNNFCGTDFNDFIQSIDFPAMVVFDEFDKVYDRADQNELLTLFDGVFPTKKLFVVTTNESVIHYMKNRPGRMFYTFDYQNVTEEEIREFCEDRLNDTSDIDSIVLFNKVYQCLNFDILSAVTEEMNRYEEDFKTVLKYLNVSSELGYGYRNWEIDVFCNDEFVEKETITEANIDPLKPNYSWWMYSEETNPSPVKRSEKTEAPVVYSLNLKELFGQSGSVFVSMKSFNFVKVRDDGVFIYEMEKDGKIMRLEMKEVVRKTTSIIDSLF